MNMNILINNKEDEGNDYFNNLSTEQLKNLKIFNISSSKSAKKMEDGDAYYIKNGVVKRIRVTLK